MIYIMFGLKNLKICVEATNVLFGIVDFIGDKLQIDLSSKVVQLYYKISAQNF